MDIASLAGVILGIVLFVFGVINGGGNLNDFVDGPSIIITIGGSLASTLSAHKLPDFINGLKSIDYHTVWFLDCQLALYADSSKAAG